MIHRHSRPHSATRHRLRAASEAPDGIPAALRPISTAGFHLNSVTEANSGLKRDSAYFALASCHASAKPSRIHQRGNANTGTSPNHRNHTPRNDEILRFYVSTHSGGAPATPQACHASAKQPRMRQRGRFSCPCSPERPFWGYRDSVCTGTPLTLRSHTLQNGGIPRFSTTSPQRRTARRVHSGHSICPRSAKREKNRYRGTNSCHCKHVNRLTPPQRHEPLSQKRKTG